MNSQIIVSILIVLFLYNIGDFYKEKGMDYPLLKILFQLILIIFLIVFFFHKKELIDENQKKIEDYFKKFKHI